MKFKNYFDQQRVIQIIIASAALLVVLFGLWYVYGNKNNYIKPPAVKLLASNQGLAQFRTLAAQAQSKIDELLGKDTNLTTMQMNPGVTIFFPSSISMSADAYKVVEEITKEALKEVGAQSIALEPDTTQWFGREKQHIMVVKYKPNNKLKALRNIIEQKAKERGLLPQDYQSPPYRPHSSLVGVSGTGYLRAVLEGDDLQQWLEVSEQNKELKKKIPSELLPPNTLVFDTVVIFGHDFKPKSRIHL